jgi:hypothetical protein
MHKFVRVQDREAPEDACESSVSKQFPRAPYALPAAVHIIFDRAAARDPPSLIKGKNLIII